MSVHMYVARMFFCAYVSLLFSNCSRNVKIKQQTSNGIYIVSVREVRNAIVLVGKHEEKALLKDLGIDERIILK